jgi:hypothetical protein
MDNQSESTMNSKSVLETTISWLFGMAVSITGLVNTFWGNDTGFGLFLILLSFVYYPPANRLLYKWTGILIPPIAKIILGIFIIWASLGVGELFDKIDLMLQDL